MDKELRDAFAELKQDQKEGFREVQRSMECLRTDFFNHATESAQRWGVVDASARAAHHRIDEIRDAAKSVSGNRWAMWVAVVSSALAFIGATVLLYLQFMCGGVT